MKAINKFITKYGHFFHWYNFVAYFLVLRFVTDISYKLIYAFIIVMLIFRIRFEKIALIFFSIGVIIYVLGMNVEANHYFSFVYGFIILTFLKSLLIIFRRRIKYRNS